VDANTTKSRGSAATKLYNNASVVSVYEVPMFQGNYLEELQANLYAVDDPSDNNVDDGNAHASNNNAVNVLAPIVHRDLLNVPPVCVFNVSDSTDLGGCSSIVHLDTVRTCRPRSNNDLQNDNPPLSKTSCRSKENNAVAITRIGHITVLTSEGLVLVLELLQKCSILNDADEQMQMQLEMKSIVCFDTGEAGATCACSYLTRSSADEGMSNGRSCISVFTGHGSGIVTLHEVQCENDEPHEHNGNLRNPLEQQLHVSSDSKDSEHDDCAIDSSRFSSDFSRHSRIAPRNTRENNYPVSLCMTGYFDVPVSAVSLFGWHVNGIQVNHHHDDDQHSACENNNYLAVGLSGYASDHHDSPLTGSLEIVELIPARKRWESSKNSIVELREFSVWPHSGMGMADGSMLKRRYENRDGKRGTSNMLYYDEGNPICQIVLCPCEKPCIAVCDENGLVVSAHGVSISDDNDTQASHKCLSWGVTNELNQILLPGPAISIDVIYSDDDGNNNVKLVCCLRDGTVYALPVVSYSAPEGARTTAAAVTVYEDPDINNIRGNNVSGKSDKCVLVHHFAGGMIHYDKFQVGRSKLEKDRRLRPLFLFSRGEGIMEVFTDSILDTEDEYIDDKINDGTVQLLVEYLQGGEANQDSKVWIDAKKECSEIYCENIIESLAAGTGFDAFRRLLLDLRREQ